MNELAGVSLAVIALVYVILALGAFVGIIILISLYAKIKKRLDGLKKQIEPYQSKVDFMFYKSQEIVEIAEQLAKDAKELSDEVKTTTEDVIEKAKDTTFEIMDKTKESFVEVSSLIVNTKNRVEAHTEYLFDRVKAIEEKLDDVYAFLTGVSKATSKLLKKEE